ncbi:uncharacterized protein LOC143256376 [Tachypleus tridentatus]|uniref:uncharacterized protein LOC143256376 n=1 Tax=Tachypleus tridentatus TaxID=6853 RepID=UPI003FD64A66
MVWRLQTESGTNMNCYKGKRKTDASASFSTGRKMKDSNIEHCYEGKGTISNLLPHFGFIRTEKPYGETVSFDVFSFEDGKVKSLSDLPLKVGQEVNYLAEEGRDGSKAKYYAYRVWRPEYHKIFSKSPSLGRNTAHSLSSSGRVSDMSYQDSMVSVTGSEKSNSYSSNTFSSLSSMSEDTLEICSHTEEKHASGTCREAKKLIEQKGKIYPEGETKAQIIFGTPEEYVLVINDVVFYHEHPVTSLMWHIDDGECVKFDAVQNDSFSGFHWIAIMVWVGNRPKCSLTDDIKNKDNVEKLIKKYEHIFVSKYNSSNSLKYSVGENEGFKYEWGEASLSANDTSSYTTYLSDDENEKHHVSECQVENSSSNGKSDCVSGILHEKFGREVIGEYLNTSCKKDSLVTLKKLSECVLTEEKMKDIPGLTEENVTKDIPGLIGQNVEDIPGLMEENRLEPSVEMFKRARNHHLKIDKKVEVFCTNTICEIVHKPHLPKCSPFIVSINGENKIGEVCDKAKSVKIRIVYLKSNTPGADKVKYPLLKNIAFAEGTVNSVNEFFVFLNIKNSVAPVFLSKIYLDGKEVSKNNRNLKSIFEENELVYFAYMHALLSSNSEWVYVYLLWKGQKPKTFVKPTAEDFIEKLGFRNIIILGSEIIPQNRQEEQINSGHKVLEVTYMKVKQDSSSQNKTKKMTKAKVKKAGTTNSKITTSKYQKRSEFHELSHKEDTQSHPELRNTDSNRPEKNDASFSNISTSNSILKSNVCQPRSGSERVGKIYCSKTLESSQNMVKKDVLLIAPVRMESTTETNVGCLKTSESLPSQPLDKVTTINSANLKSTPETNVDKVGYSREFDLKLKTVKEINLIIDKTT